MADAGPLIALARIGGLGWLTGLFGTVLIPQAVWIEATGAADKPGARTIAALVGMTGFEVDGTEGGAPLADAPPRLGPGESAAIRLALAHRGWVLLDDSLARRHAERCGLPVIGVLGILRAAKRSGLTPAVGPAIRELTAIGYRLSRALIRATLVECGENPGD